jgi:hypothetical protein
MQSKSTLKSATYHNGNTLKNNSQKPTNMQSKSTLKSAKNIKSTKNKIKKIVYYNTIEKNGFKKVSRQRIYGVSEFGKYMFFKFVYASAESYIRIE